LYLPGRILVDHTASAGGLRPRSDLRALKKRVCD
jgi:hypothetical protein